MMRLNSNATIRETLTSTALTGVLDAALVTTYLIVLFFVHFGLGWIVLGLGLLRVLVYLLTRRKHRELMTESLQAQASSSNYQVQMIEGIETIKTSGAEREAMEHWSNLLVDFMNVSLARGRLNAIVDSLLGALATASPLILLGYGGYLVLEGSLSLGTMLAMNALAAGFLGPLSSLVNTALQLQMLGSYIERVDDVLDKEPEQDATATRAAPVLEGAIRLDNVSFRYSEHGPWVVRNASLAIEKGQKIAIVGKSGSGKTTLSRLLVGLVRPESGSILFDGRSMDGYELSSLRRQVGFVPQSPFLFASSVRHNIELGSVGATFEDVQRAARQACIDTEILELPLAYDTPLASGGGSLSGGQRQRIALARALLREPRILVLDEATSHLDALTEAQVHDGLATLQSTRILIAHRLSTIVDADAILVMDEGEIVESGAHADLMARGGIYASLVRNQMRGMPDS